jgi:hypothetical protein
MSTGVNDSISSTENLFKTLVIDPEIAALKVTYPILGVWPFSAILDALVNLLFAQAKTFIDVNSIKLLNSAHQSAYEQASLNLLFVQNQKGINSDEYKKARADALTSLSKFVRYNQ